jgi:integrase
MGHTVQPVNTKSTRLPQYRGDPVHAASLIYDREGNRKYLTLAERSNFLATIHDLSPEVQTFCLMLSYTGARISEVLALTPSRVDPEAGIVVLESLKKRRRGAFRAVPLPDALIRELDRVHHVAERRRTPGTATRPLWGWCRTTAWTRVKAGMAAAEISGPQASPKGFRHAFAVGALQAGVPINLVRRWLGHARISTTEIYADAIGPEERAMAGKLWATF